MGRVLLYALAIAFLASADAQPTCTEQQSSWSGSAVQYVQGGTTYAFVAGGAIGVGCRLDVASFGNFQYGTTFSVAQLSNFAGTCNCPGGGTLVEGTECRENPADTICVFDWRCFICVNGQGANGDPHFVGLDGFAFDLQGEPGHYYNFLSHAETQATFGIVPRGSHFADVRGWYRLPTHKNTSTWIGSFSVKHRGDVLTVIKHQDMSLQVDLNNKTVAFGSTVATGTGMVVSYGDKLHKGGEHTHKLYATSSKDEDYTTQHVSVDTPLFLFDIDIPPTFSRRIDVWVGLHQPPAELEGQCTGVVGETVRAKHPLGATDMEEVYDDVEKVWDEHENELIRYSAKLEGEVKVKYEVSSLVSDDFPLNKYEGTPLRTDRARKLAEQPMPVQRPIVASTLVYK